MKMNFKTTYLVFLVMLCFIVIGLYYSYAIFVTRQLQENVVSLKMPVGKVVLNINNQGNKVLVKKESVNKYFINLRNTTGNDYYYEILFKSPKEKVKVYSTSELVKNTILANEEKMVEVSIQNDNVEDILVEFFVQTSSEKVFDKEIGYSYVNKDEGYDHSGANKPKLDKMNLIPVYYQKISDTEGFWYKADVNNKDGLWYDYDHQIWANAVLVSDSNYKKYMKMEVNQEINDSDILGFYVWIPRFKYTILNYNNYTSFENNYNILFEKDIENTGTVTCLDKISDGEDRHLYSEVCSDTKYGKIYDNLSTYTHPAFNDTGFWIAKFLMSGESNIMSLPNMHFIKRNVSDAIDFSNNVLKDKSHLLTNMEYSSVVMLTNSLYGKSGNDAYYKDGNYTFKRVYINSYVNDITGCSSEYTSRSKNFLVTTAKTCVAYNDLTNYSHVSNSINYKVGEIGSGASTTGNIYGVYDVANQYGEIVSAFTASFDGDIMLDINNYDLYSYNEYLGTIASSTTMSNLYRYKLGDSIREGFRSIKENGMWQGGILEHKEMVGVMLRGGNGDIKNASIYTTSIVNINYEAPFRVAIS